LEEADGLLDTTISFFEQAPSERNPVNTGVEFSVLDAWGRAQKHPMLFDRFVVGSGLESEEVDLSWSWESDPKAHLILTWTHGNLFLVVHSTSLRVLVNTQPANNRELFDGDLVEAGNLKMKVHGLKTPLASLEGYTPPHLGQRWLLEIGSNPVGRRGQRVNRVELADPTVSRSHADFVVSERGVTLETQTASSQTKKNSTVLAASTAEPVHDGDLLQFGKQLFRLHFQPSQGAQLKSSPTQAAVLCIQWKGEGKGPADYAAAFQRVRSCDQQGLSHLPFDGESLIYFAFDRLGQSGGLERLLCLSSQLQKKASEQDAIQVRQALHTDTADRQPPAPNYVSLKRSLRVARGLLAHARFQGHPVIISRSAWEQAPSLGSVRRLGTVQLQGEFAPIEAYEIEGI